MDAPKSYDLFIPPNGGGDDAASRHLQHQNLASLQNVKSGAENTDKTKRRVVYRDKFL